MREALAVPENHRTYSEKLQLAEVDKFIKKRHWRAWRKQAISAFSTLSLPLVEALDPFMLT